MKTMLTLVCKAKICKAAGVAIFKHSVSFDFVS